MAKRLYLVLVLAIVYVLTGCTQLVYQNVNDLLRAPAMGAEQNEIQQVLEAYLGGYEPQYKYPLEGSWRSPLLQEDLNGDGQNEAIILYSVAETSTFNEEKGSNVYVAILEQADGSWTVTADLQGLATDVASIQVANLLGGNTQQLIIGYTFGGVNTAGKSLAVYEYDASVLVPLRQYSYSRYEIGDLTGSGAGNDFVVVSGAEQEEGLTLRHIPVQDGSFAAEHPAVQLDANFSACAAITPGVNAEGEPLLVVDGVVGDSLVSQIVYFSGERFYTIESTTDTRGPTARQNLLLKSRDINNDGMVEIPITSGGISTMSGNNNLTFVEWTDFFTDASAPTAVQHGVLDSTKNIYIRLPESWLGSIRLLDGDDAGEWQMVNNQTQQPLLSVSILSGSETVPAGAQLLPGSISTYIEIHSGVPILERELIQLVALS